MEPMELLTAMSPSPILATMTLERRSGTDVPAARNVTPMTTGGMVRVFPMISAEFTMTYENHQPVTQDVQNELMTEYGKARAKGSA